MAFAVGALGDKAPALPQLATVADTVPPAVSEGPVFRGRGAHKEAIHHGKWLMFLCLQQAAHST